MTDAEQILAQITALASEVRALRAIVAQLGPVNVKLSADEEVAMARAQGASTLDLLRSKTSKQRRNKNERA